MSSIRILRRRHPALKVNRTTTLHPFWSREPLTLVINLDDRPQRWADTVAAAASCLPVDSLIRFSAIRGTRISGFGTAPWFHGRPRDNTWAGRAGCLLSHRNAIARAEAEKTDWLLIFEDDIVFTLDFDPCLRALAPLLEEDPDWAVCYLGFCDPLGPFQTLRQLTSQHTLHRIGGANTTHAYLLPRRVFVPLLAALPTETTVWPWIARHRAIDRWYGRHLGDFGKVLAVSPSIVNQRVGLSDITCRDTGEDNSAGQRTTIGSDSFLPALRRANRKLCVLLSDVWDGVRAKNKQRNGF